MSIKDLVQNALSDNIDQLRADFSEELNPVLAARMNERKQEIAQAYFGQMASITETTAKE